MKKVLFTSILLLSVVSFGGNIYAQDTAGGNDTEATTPSTTQPSVKFTADGNTLTISGQGDLTSYMTTDYSARVFTDNAVNNVFTAANAYSSVTANSSYDSNNTYYHSVFTYSQLFDGGMPSGTKYVYGVTTTQSWKDEALKGTLYSGYLSYDNTTFVLDTKITSSTSGLDKLSQTFKNGEDEYSVYVIVPNADEDYLNKSISLSEDADNYYATAGIKLLTLAEVNSYVKSTTTYTCGWNNTIFLAKSEDGEKTQLTAGQTYTYNEGDLFYVGNASYEPIANNDEFFKTNSDYIKADPKEISVAQLTLSKILQGNYEKVEFVNTGSDNLLINAEIVQSILFPNGNQNGTIKDLDLGQATIENLNGKVFENPGADYSYSSTLESLTLPLTNETTVVSPTTKTGVSKMVVPSGVIPSGYNDDKSALKTVTIPEKYEYIAEKAFFQNKQISTFNFPSTLKYIGNSAFEECGALDNLVLNDGLENIGKRAFTSTMTDETRKYHVTFPSSLKIIDDEAFMGCRICDLKFNAGLKYIGNSALALPSEQTETTLEIPVSVRYIGPFAFNYRQYQDVFFYGAKAPVMPLGTANSHEDWGKGTAFSTHTQHGNDGFNSGKGMSREELDAALMDNAYTDGYASRENYKNHGVYFCMLHFPKGLEDDARATYTDITRSYKTKAYEEGKFPYSKYDDETTYDSPGINQKEDLSWSSGSVTLNAAKTVSWGYQDTYLGMQYVWPSQDQWDRAFVVSYNGYNWDGDTKYRPTLDEEELAALKYAGFDTSEENMDELKKIAYLGTRLFVLSNADVNVDNDEDNEPEYPINIRGGQWWTLCVPFNMTKKMIDDTFGENTEVCLFDRVVREINYKTNKNRIVLYFTQNVYKHKTERKNANGTWSFNPNAKEPTDDEIVIYAHESYMIHPTKTNEDARFVVQNYVPVVGSPTPTVVNGKNQIVGSSSDIRDDVPYRYVGNYLAKVDVQTETQANNSVATQSTTEVTIPKYSYVFAKAGNEAPKFWFLNADGMIWQPNKCVVQTNTRSDGALDYEEFFDYNASGAKQASFFGEDFIDTPTSIEDEMVIIAGEGSDAAVYSLDGTLVNTTGDLSGLAKGVYIKGGKKYVVK